MLNYLFNTESVFGLFPFITFSTQLKGVINISRTWKWPSMKHKVAYKQTGHVKAVGLAVYS